MWIYLLAGFILAAIAWQDRVSHRIPNYMIVLLLICGVARGLWDKSFWCGVVGIIICGLPIFLLSMAPRSGEIGGGDVKLCAALGALLGPLYGYMVITLGLLGLSVYGLLTTRRINTVLPFAPFVFPAYLIVIFVKEGMKI